ncbi:acetylornithine deacetylase [Marinobacterium nitratireducens]|uniref:Acetylornithine deacetylase n=1 Tax=Marinobacterium nitratireducens TaxID=518897 RepID=A0A918DPA5_9GAMM|nr:acetylornithine deacetylase [Marinobacterium nitratireducens]GGO77977.1 acetylornithine deacetylase [Marinobacterium nitratireducens]
MPAIPDLVTMLRELIAAPSISCTSPGWDQSNLGVIEKLESWLASLGFRTEVMPIPGFPGKANLIATLGTGPGGLVFSGHTDTVPCNDELWHSDPFRLDERDNRFYGLGTCDMKGFFPLAIEAARRFVDQPLKQPLIILATADEESSMSGARALAEAGKPRARYAVIGEPTGMKPIYMHKGIMMEAVRVTGRAGHSSDPSLGASALEAMHGVMGELIAFRRELQQQYRQSDFAVAVPTLNLGCIHGGDNPNRICGRCELEFDLRPLPGMSIDVLREAIHKRLAPLQQPYGVQIEVEALFPGIPSFQNERNSDLVRTAERLTGHNAQAVAFGTEAPFLKDLGMDTIVMGPGHIEQAHQPDEYLGFDQIKPTVAILEQLIQKYCLQDSPDA